MFSKIFWLFAFSAMTAASLSAGDYTIRRLRLNHRDGIYKCGEEVVVSGRLLKNASPVTTGKLRVITKWEGKEVAQKDIPCDGQSFKVSYKSDKPGWVYFAFMVIDADGKVIEKPAPRVFQIKKLLVGEIGAIYEPEKIKTKCEMPADFKEFWQEQRKKLDNVPFNTKLTKLDSGDPKIELYAVEADAGVSRPMTAYLAFPVGAKPKSLSAYVDFLSWSNSDANRNFAISNAKRGLLAMAATWHGFPVAQPAAFYTPAIRKGFNAAKDINNREKWSFRDTYIRVLRALDYIKSRPEWDGKTLVVQGGSLGGAETTTAAALDPQVTTAIISVPCFCEFSAYLAGRKGSIPVAARKTIPDDIRNALNYYDLVNLATLIKCEVFFCTGYADELCPPSNVIAAYNNLPADTPKEFYGNPYTGHYGTTQNVHGNKRLKKFFENVKVNPYTEKY